MPKSHPLSAPVTKNHMDQAGEELFVGYVRLDRPLMHRRKELRFLGHKWSVSAIRGAEWWWETFSILETMLQHFRRSVDVLNLLVRCSVCVCVIISWEIFWPMSQVLGWWGIVCLELLTPAKDIHKLTPANKHSWLENEPSLKIYFLYKEQGDFALLC